MTKPRVGIGRERSFEHQMQRLAVRRDRHALEPAAPRQVRRLAAQEGFCGDLTPATERGRLEDAARLSVRIRNGPNSSPNQ